MRRGFSGLLGEQPQQLQEKDSSGSESGLLLGGVGAAAHSHCAALVWPAARIKGHKPSLWFPGDSEEDEETTQDEVSSHASEEDRAMATVKQELESDEHNGDYQQGTLDREASEPSC